MIVVDTGPLVALLDAGDRHHRRCRDWLSRTEVPLIVPVPVVTETCYFIERAGRPEIEAEFLASFDTGKRFQMVDLGADDWMRVRALVLDYADLPLGVVDASVVAVAERLGTPEIASLDHRHFTVVRPSHISSLTLLP